MSIMRAILRNVWIVLFVILLALVGLRPSPANTDLPYYLLVYLAAWGIYLLLVYAWLMWRFPALRANNKS